MNTALPAEHWSRLYRDSFPRVYRGLVATLFDRELALDALQDAFLEGLRRPPRHDANLEGWLYRVALRKAGRESRRRSLFRPLSRTGSDDDRTIETVLARVEVRRLLVLLSERQRAIVIAHFYLGMRHQEVADLLGIRAGTVGATISQALQRMRKEANGVA
ncbi:MAG TPA: RNA polymerase sigma factor [Candidatus Limnocylindria bacterium]